MLDQIDQMKSRLKEIHEIAHKLRIRDYRLYVLINDLIDILEYVLNSTSLYDEELYGFDRRAILEKLQFLEREIS